MAKIETDWQKALKENNLALANWGICEVEGYEIKPVSGKWQLFKDGVIAGPLHKTKNDVIWSAPTYLFAPVALQKLIIDTLVEPMELSMHYDTKDKLWSIWVIFPDGLDAAAYEHSEFLVALYYVYMIRKGQYVHRG